ncbi:DUF3325 domain-containing protein [Ottowia thiooxydans]|uniref:DUF3325 domain-containing protein n=1 Tax=Ottowia thiooxydans TaxID=219182 RepID=UPI00040C194E|nr:DUF3325 domain-containing protein [Ottowia thiooxydans]
MTLIALSLCLAAFTALSLAMERHQEQVFGRTLTRSATMGWRSLGWALLLLSLIPCLALGSASLAITVWLGVLTFGALSLGLLLTYAPRTALPVFGTALIWGTLAWVWWV